MSKLDLSKADKAYYKASLSPEIIELPTLGYITIAGQGDPNGEDFMAGIEALYAASYGIKFGSKEAGKDFVVPKMECFWWIDAEDQSQFEQTPREEWLWNILIRMPDFIDEETATKGIAIAREKKGKPAMDRLKYEQVEGGSFAHILHLGSYTEERETLDKLEEYLSGQGWQHAGHHREIYLSDPRRTAEDKLKTIIRYKVQMTA